MAEDRATEEVRAAVNDSVSKGVVRETRGRAAVGVKQGLRIASRHTRDRGGRSCLRNWPVFNDLPSFWISRTLTSLPSTPAVPEVLVTNTTPLTRANGIDPNKDDLCTVGILDHAELDFTVDMERLPVELVEQLVPSLAFTDICNLRLVSHDLHAKTTQRQFRSFAPRTKGIHIADDHLRTFAAVTERGGIGCAVEHVELVAVLEKNQSLGEAPAGELVLLLTKAFDNLHAYASSKVLASLELTFFVHKEEMYWTPNETLSNKYGLGHIEPAAIWDVSSRAFQILLAALSASSVRIDELKIFSQMSDWSMPCGGLFNGLSDNLTWPTFPHTKRLALSLSPSLVRSEEDAKHVILCLEAFPNLESLELKWFSLKKPTPEERTTADNVLKSISKHIHLPQLTSSSFDSFRADSETLFRLWKQSAAT